MNKNTFFTICLLGITAPLARAHYSTSIVNNNTTCIQTMEEGVKLPLQKREKENHGEVKYLEVYPDN